MTGLLNRTAYENKIGELEEDVSAEHIVSLVKFRIIGLKDTELTYGSKAKEEVIQTAARLVSLSFRNIASCYHIEEEDFIVVMEAVGKEAEMAGFSYLNRRLYNCNKSRGEKIKLIYAFERANLEDTTIKDLIRSVDEALEKEEKEENV